MREGKDEVRHEEQKDEDETEKIEQGKTSFCRNGVGVRCFDAELLRFTLYAFGCARRSIRSKKTPSRQMW